MSNLNMKEMGTLEKTQFTISELQKVGWTALAEGIQSGEIEIHQHGYVRFHEYFKDRFGKAPIEVVDGGDYEPKKHKIAPEFYATVIRNMYSLPTKTDDYELMRKYGTHISPDVKWSWFGTEAWTWIMDKDRFLSMMKEEGYLN